MVGDTYIKKNPKHTNNNLTFSRHRHDKNTAYIYILYCNTKKHYIFKAPRRLVKILFLTWAKLADINFTLPSAKTRHSSVYTSMKPNVHFEALTFTHVDDNPCQFLLCHLFLSRLHTCTSARFPGVFAFMFSCRSCTSSPGCVCTPPPALRRQTFLTNIYGYSYARSNWYTKRTSYFCKTKTDSLIFS